MEQVLGPWMKAAPMDASVIPSSKQYCDPSVGLANMLTFWVTWLKAASMGMAQP